MLSSSTGSNPRPPGLQSDADPTEPPRPAVKCNNEYWSFTNYSVIRWGCFFLLPNFVLAGIYTPIYIHKKYFNGNRVVFPRHKNDIYLDYLTSQMVSVSSPYPLKTVPDLQWCPEVFTFLRTVVQ